MSPEERQLLNGLFERIKSASNSPRDEEAQAFITDQVKTLPAAPYLLSQTVIVQEQALEGANARIKQLEARLAEANSKGSGGFLSGLFGQRQADPPLRATGPWGQNMGGYQPPQPQAYTPDASGGSFLRGALGTAAGVAGGVLLAESIRSLFYHPGLGGMSNLGIGADYTPAGDTTIINNYYGDEAQGDPGDQGATRDADYGSSGYDGGDSSDVGYDDSAGFDSGGDGGFDV